MWSRSSAACAGELFAGHGQDVAVLAEVVEMSSVKLRLRKWWDEAAEEMGKARSLRLSVAAQPRQSTATYSSGRRRGQIYQLTHTRLQVPLIRHQFTCPEKAREKSRATTFGVPSQLWEQGLSNLNREQEGRAAPQQHLHSPIKLHHGRRIIAHDSSDPYLDTLAAHVADQSPPVSR